MKYNVSFTHHKSPSFNSMSSTDPHQGGDLSDMAATGTSMPNDAGQHDLLPSVPRPDQEAENPAFHNQFLNSSDQQAAVGNSADMPRRFNDTGATGEVITGTGDQLPAGVESKKLGQEGGGPLAKGSERYGKHVRQKESGFEDEGAEADAPPGEEELEQDEVREGKGL